MMKESTLVKRVDTADKRHKVICSKLFARYKNGKWKMKPGKIRDRYVINEEKAWKAVEKAIDNYKAQFGAE